MTACELPGRTRNGYSKSRINWSPALGRRDIALVAARPAARMDAVMIARARRLLSQPEESVTSIARLLGVSRTTLYRHLPELGS